MEKLTLYVGTVCPFCKKVEAFMEDAGIDSVEIKNIDEDLSLIHISEPTRPY